MKGPGYKRAWDDRRGKPNGQSREICNIWAHTTQDEDKQNENNAKNLKDQKHGHNQQTRGQKQEPNQQTKGQKHGPN